MTPAPLSAEYAALLADITVLCESNQALFAPSPAGDRQRIDFYWRMGRRIIEVVQNGKERGTYGQQVLAQLSRDLTEKFGSGFGDRTVRHIRRFAIVYPKLELRDDLSWSHYRTLLMIDDDALRHGLEQRAVDEKLTKEQLLALVRGELRRREGAAVFPLTPREASGGICKVILSAAGRKPLLDLGFNVTRELPIKGVRDLQDGEFVQRKGDDRFSRIACEPGARYRYPGEVLKVIDGDTVKMRMDLGFGTFVDETMRLRGVDAAELDTEEGKNAHRALQKLLKNAEEITVLTYSHDRYGRYIADLIVDGKYINKALVESGAALFLNM